MNKSILTISALLVIISMILTGCGPQAAPEPQAAAVETQAPEPAATEAPAPTEIPTPTETPPMPCTIAFNSDRDGNLEIYTMGPDGKNLTNLTNDPGDDFEPAWSPDGSQIAFVSNRDGGQYIYVMNADGSNVRQLSHVSISDSPDWSNDGSRITYTAGDDIFVADATGSEKEINLTNSPTKDWRPVWSPDSSRIAWLSDSEGNYWDVFVMDADGSNAGLLTHEGRVTSVKWTVDGQLLTQWDRDKAGCFNCVMDADGSNFSNAGGKGDIQHYLPFWTEDGKQAECAGIDINTGNSEVYLIGDVFPDGLLNLTNNPAEDYNTDWPAKCGPGSAAIAAASQGDIVIGYAGDEERQIERKNDFQKACNEIDIRCVYGETTALIDQGVDAIIQNSDAAKVESLTPSIAKAKEKGIPVFVLDAETSAEGAYNVTIDQYLWAKNSLEWMVEKTGGKGEFAYFNLQPFSGHTEAIDEVLANHPEISLVEHRDPGYDRNKVKPETTDFTKTYPDLKAIWSNVNQSEAIRGLEESGIPQKQWPLVLCEATRDGLATWTRIQKANPGFDCIALANPTGIAYDAVYAAYYLATGARINEAALGGKYGNSLYVDIPVITKDNCEEWLKKLEEESVFYADELMTPDAIKARWFIE